MKTRILNAVLGFMLGIVAMPLILVASPFALAWWMYNETEEEGRNIKE